MESFGPTDIADCEIIIKAFEKASIYSNDPKSVYAMTTPILSKMRSDANNIDNQFEKQFEYTKKLQKRGATPNAGMPQRSRSTPIESASASQAQLTEEEFAAYQEEIDQEEAEASSSPPDQEQEKDWFSEGLDSFYGDEDQSIESMTSGQQFMNNCIPCADKLRNSVDFNKKFWGGMGSGNAIDQWVDVQKAHLLGAVGKLKSILDMFRNQGSNMLMDICSFLDLFDAIKCPSDIITIIKGLSTFLIKLSIDLLGDMNWLMDLVAALITPLLSSVIQLLKNFIDSIIDPLWCIIDSLQKVVTDSLVGIPSAALDFAQEVGESRLGGEYKVADRDYTKASSYLPFTESGKGVNPQVEFSNFPNWMEPGSGTAGVIKRQNEKKRTPELFGYNTELSVPKLESDITYRHYLELDRKKAEMERLAGDGVISQAALNIDPEYKKLKKEHDNAGWHLKSMKAIEDSSKWVDELQDTVKSTIETVIDSLMEMSLWIENFVREWIQEFGRLVGDSMTVEMGFLAKQGKKLTTLQAIAVFSAFLKIVGKANKCKKEDLIEEILTEAYGYGSNTVVRSEDGTVSIVDQLTGEVVSVAGIELFADLNLQPTGDPSFDAKVSAVEQSFSTPTKMVFSCNNKIHANENAAQIKEWMQSLDEISV